MLPLILSCHLQQNLRSHNFSFCFKQEKFAFLDWDVDNNLLFPLSNMEEDFILPNMFMALEISSLVYGLFECAKSFTWFVWFEATLYSCKFVKHS